MKVHDFSKSKTIGSQSAEVVRRWLERLPQTLGIISVEEHKRYQRRDIDFLWETAKGIYRVEVKGDTVGHRTGNFFFETISNDRRRSPGCFMYTEADLLFYFMIKSGELYIMPVEPTREWFEREKDRFKKHRVPNRRYNTIGHLVPVDVVINEVSCLKFQIPIEKREEPKESIAKGKMGLRTKREWQAPRIHDERKLSRHGGLVL